MEVQVTSKNLKVNDEVRSFAQERVEKLERYIGAGATAKLELAYQHQRTGGSYTTAQLTVAQRQTILRAEEAHEDVRRAIDMAVDTMLTQIRRYHSKRVDRSRRPSRAGFVTLPELSLEEQAEVAAAEQDHSAEIVRQKRFELRPMTSDEAIDQLELLGHTFYVFLNAEDNQINVLYRRKQGNYGLLQPTM